MSILLCALLSPLLLFFFRSLSVHGSLVTLGVSFDAAVVMVDVSLGFCVCVDVRDGECVEGTVTVGVLFWAGGIVVEGNCWVGSSGVFFEVTVWLVVMEGVLASLSTGGV